MSASLNRVQLIGNLGADPEIRTLPEGGRVASLSVATTEKWNDKESGEKRERTEWNRVAIFAEPLIALAEKYLHKGSKVYLEGSLQTRKYQKDGSDHYSTEVVLKPYSGNLTLLDAPKTGPERPAQNDKPTSGLKPAA